MSNRKSSISHASPYQEIGEYWDTHDVADLGADETRRIRR